MHTSYKQMKSAALESLQRIEPAKTLRGKINHLVENNPGITTGLICNSLRRYEKPEVKKCLSGLLEIDELSVEVHIYKHGGKQRVAWFTVDTLPINTVD